ncbi:MAG: SWIM zinc finger family protein [Chloroflexota bacterium]
MARRKKYYNYYSDFTPSTLIATEDGIKARSQRGTFAKNWWADRWIKALERLVDSGRLSRGRSYARKGQVLSIEETKNGVTARVQGSRRTPYKITIQLASLTDTQWEKVIDALAEQAIFTAQLLAGEMPQDIEDAFTATGVSLFPSKRADLTTECSCPDYANPCKHVAATHYILGERFDEDPFLLFRLRGRNQEEILQALRKHRAGQEAMEEDEEPEIIIPLEETITHFWALGQALETFAVSIRSPQIEMPLLKRLGEPAFAPDSGIQPLLGSAYRSIGRAAQEIAYADEETQTSCQEP